MTVHVGKEGVFAFAADVHEVMVPIASGSFDPQSQTVELTIDAKDMQVQDPPSRRDQVQANMLGPEVLNVERYPTIAFRSTRIQVVDASHWNVAGDLTLHGQTRLLTIHVERQDATHFTGSADMVQSAFGITPIRIVGGAVRVKDTVNVSFSIALD
jgi:polyisoprenoid-binding protein YceI